MRVKTFRGPSSASVIARIKSELGPEAVILSTRHYKEDGQNICEIAAALEQDPPAKTATKTKTRAAEHASDRVRKAAQTVADAAGEELFDPRAAMGDWRREWQCIKEHLTTLLKPQMDLSRLKPRQRLALEYLEREGVAPELCLALFRELTSSAKPSTLQALEGLAPVAPWSFEAFPSRVHGLTGPHGVGKTTALIRMALALRKEKPKAEIMLVNADAAKSAGRMLLRQYAELCEFGYAEAASPEECREALAEGRGADRVLVDLPALRRGETLDQSLDRLGYETFDAIAGKGREAQAHLVLCPHYAQQQLTAFLRAYGSHRLAGLVWTKLDEAYTFGSMINTGASAGLPATAFSVGAGLKDTLTPARHDALWRLVFKHQLPGVSSAASADSPADAAVGDRAGATQRRRDEERAHP